MVRLVRVIDIVDGDAEELRRRTASLPPSVAAEIVVTSAGVLVTLTKSYRPTPGSRGRAVRALQRTLHALLRA